MTLIDQDEAAVLARRTAIDLNYILDRTLEYALDLDYDDNQAFLFLDYLDTNTLFTDCLRLAYVSDRIKIENSLLLPPGEWSDE